MFKRDMAFGVIIILINAFLLVNIGSLLTPGAASEFKDILLVYMLILASITANFNVKNPLMRMDWRVGIIKYVLTFFGVVIFLSMFPRMINYQTPFVFSFYAILFGMVVAFNEDVIFGAILPDYVGKIPAALIFSLFHFSVYTSSSRGMSLFVALAFAFIFGLLSQRIIRNGKLGLPVSAGIHAAYNLFAMGLI